MQDDEAEAEPEGAWMTTDEMRTELSVLRRLLVLVCNKANATPLEIDEAVRGPVPEVHVPDSA